MKIPKIIILRGIPASGKSTYAKEKTLLSEKIVRINRDDIRSMMGYSFNNYDNNIEKVITDTTNKMMIDFLNKGYDVIMDNLNLKQSYVNDIHNLAEDLGNVIVEEIHFPVELEVALERNRERGLTVPENVIKELHEKFKNIKIKPSTFYGNVIKKVEYDKTLSDCIICDIDGTIALFDRNKKNPYDRDFENDEVNNEVNLILRLYIDSLSDIDLLYESNKIIFVSGRSDKFRDVTEKWIKKNVYINDSRMELHMRKEGDFRRDSIIKKEIYNEHIKGKYNVDFVLDDRNQTVNMWRREGLKCFQVAEGNF